MLALLVLHPNLRRVYNKFRPTALITTEQKTTADGRPKAVDVEAEARLEQRASFDFGFALLFIIALHGFSALKILLILYINYSLATKLPRKYVVSATWAFNVGTLFANEMCDGYKYSEIERVLSAFMSGPLTGSDAVFKPTWGGTLDSFGGIMSRWEILFNITVLRLISFNIDHYWSKDQRAGSPLEVRQFYRPC
jgi:hypothetical protein